MEPKEKYSRLIELAKSSMVNNLSVSESNGVLHVSGTTDTATKNKIWDVYNQIDPNMRSGDLVLDLQVGESQGEQSYEVKPGDSLSKIAQKYPGMTWQKLYEANKDEIKDPNRIYPGQQIRIPIS